jgi:hypothetical protein
MEGVGWVWYMRWWWWFARPFDNASGGQGFGQKLETEPLWLVSVCAIGNGGGV